MLNEWRMVYESEMQGLRSRGRPRMGGIDGVKGVLSKRGPKIQDMKEFVQDRRD